MELTSKLKNKISQTAVMRTYARTYIKWAFSHTFLTGAYVTKAPSTKYTSVKKNRNPNTRNKNSKTHKTPLYIIMKSF